MQFPSQLRTPVAAALLSAVWPGLGQAAAGAPRRGTIVSIPMFGLLGSFLFVGLFFRSELLTLALNGSELTSLLYLDVLWLFYHVWAIVDAYRIARGGTGPMMREDRRRRGTVNKTPWIGVVSVLLILSGTVMVHAQVAFVDMDAQHALYCLTAKVPCTVGDATFDPNATNNPDDNGDILDTPTPIASGSHATATPIRTYDPSSIPTFNQTADAQNWDADGELNVLLLGLGVQSNKAALGPDTIMVLHASMTTGAAELVSVGRNNYCTPLPTQEIAKNYASVNNCPPGTWGQMLNGLPNEILGHCARWPIPEYASTCGKSPDDNRYLRAYKGFEMTVGGLLGMHIDGSMWINPLGLTTVIDTLGGIDITVGTRLFDKPCGPSGSTQAKIAASLSAVPGTNTCQDTTHWGYYVPTQASGIQRMKDQAAASNGGLQVFSIANHPSDVAFVIQPGTYHMNGDWALAYARTRIYDPQGDFGRAARQQNLLSSLKKGLDPCRFTNPVNLLPLLNAVKAIPYGFNTDLDITNGDNLKAWANLAKNVLSDNVKQIVLTPNSVGMSGSAWDPTSISKAQQLVKTNFVKPAAASPGASGGGSKTCG